MYCCNLQLPIKFIAARTATEFKRLLEDPASNNLTGYIALVSQASVFRGAIAEWTGELGAAGLLSYPDPRDGYNLDASLTYPNGRFLPENAPIVGVMSDFNGDFLTPGLPAVDRKRDSSLWFSSRLNVILVHVSKATAYKRTPNLFVF